MDEIFNYKAENQEDYYEILGCSEHSTVEQIVTEYKARVLDCHPDKHPGDPSAAERFAKLQKAKDTLSDAETRKSYDTWRNAGLTIPYENWTALRTATHTSMHWATRKSQPMLEESDQSPSTQSSQIMKNVHIMESKENSTQNHPAFSDNKHRHGIPWERDPASEMLKKFRTYEI